MTSKDLIVVPAEAHNCLRWLAGALQAVADEGDLITMDGEQRTIGAILDDADKILGLIATQPAAGEPVEIEVPTFSHEGMGCGLEDRGITDRYEAMEYGYNEALEQQWAIINSHGPLFAAPPAAAHGDEMDRDEVQMQCLRDLYESGYNDGQNNPNGYSSISQREDAAQHTLRDMRAQAGEGGEV